MSELTQEQLRSGKVVKLSAFGKFQKATVVALSAMPKPARVLVGGGRPTVIDGNTLEPTFQAMLNAQRLAGIPGLTDRATPAASRHAMREQSAAGGGRPAPVADVTELEIPGPAGPIKARHYTPLGVTGPRPLLVFYHGGGWVLGDLDSHDAPCRAFCNEASIHVLAIDYRLAPEHKYPAGIDDSWAAYQWALANAETLGADPSRVGVGGDSAGGNISAVVAQMARDNGIQLPKVQFLIYPAVDFVEVRESRNLFAKNFLLTKKDMDRFEDHYIGGLDVDKADPKLSPIRAKSLAGLSPALITTAGFDPLRDEGNEYAQALREAGVQVDLREMKSMIHGYVNALGVGSAARRATSELSAALRKMMDS